MQKTAVKAILQQRNTVGIYCKSVITQREMTTREGLAAGFDEDGVFSISEATLVNKLWLCTIVIIKTYCIFRFKPEVSRVCSCGP